MQASEKLAIITAHNGASWYPQGQSRLINSLHHHGWPWGIEAMKCTPARTKNASGWNVETIGEYQGNSLMIFYNPECVYTLKAAAIEKVLTHKEYNHIFWLDCSVWAVKDPAPMMDLLNSDGYYFWRSGFSIWETCNSRTLEYFGISEAEARGAHDCSTSMFGLNLGNPLAKQALEMWLQAAKDGMFEGSRAEIPEHPNGRKFEHRQDQSVMSCIIHKLGLKIHDPGIYSQYANPEGKYPESVTFVMRGL